MRKIFLVCAWLILGNSYACAQPIVDKGISTTTATDEDMEEFAELFDIEENIHDPYENFNRKVFAFNEYVDYLVLKPVSSMYYYTVPTWGQNRASNALANLSEPVSAISAIFRGDFEKASNSIGRFLVNSTWGLFGLFDVASEAGIYREESSFAETLAYYNARQGPFLVLPLLGPSSPRYILGTIADTATNPFSYTLNKDTNTSIAILTAIDGRAYMLKNFDPLLENTPDKYAKVRSAYHQQFRYGGKYNE